MREDCSHFESRAYADDGEVARFCTLGLAPEAPWRCPEHCPSYERIVMISSDFDRGSLGQVPAVESEPEADPDDIAAVLADAESIVEEATPEALEELRPKRRRWWQRGKRGPDDGEDFRLSNR